MNQLLQRRYNQMAQMKPMANNNDDFNSWYNVGSAVGGAIAGGIKSKSDGQYNGTDLTKRDGYDKNISDKENARNMGLISDNSPGSFGRNLFFGDSNYGMPNYSQQFADAVDPDRKMADIAQGGDQFVTTDENGDKNIDAIGAFINGYQQASQPNVVGLQQGIQMGQNAINRIGNNSYSFNTNYQMPSAGYNPNKYKIGRYF